MENSFGPLALGALRAELRRFSVTANNIANMSTSGFRAQRALSSEVVVHRAGAPSLSQTRVASTLSDLSAAETQATGRPFDLAIAGTGFFRLATPQGEALTRDGRFGRSADGLLVAGDGSPVLDDGGAPIALPPGTIAVATDGTISGPDGIVARIGVSDVSDAGLDRRGTVRFVRPDTAIDLVDTQIQQGVIEGSNVDPVAEIAAMIETTRRYEALNGMLDREDERVRNVIETFGRTI